MVLRSRSIADGHFYAMDSNGVTSTFEPESDTAQPQNTTQADAVASVAAPDSLSRKSSVDSHCSNTAAANNSAVTRATRCRSFDSIQLTKGLQLTLPSNQSGSKDDLATAPASSIPTARQNVGTKHSVSTGCLASDQAYPTSAKVTEHFVQKVLTPTNSIRITNTSQGSCNSSRTPSVERLGSIRISTQAPVASSEETTSSVPSDSASDNNADIKVVKDTDSKSISSGSSGCLSNKKVDDSPSSIRFLPAYRDKTVDEMMSERSPRPVWQKNTKYGNPSNASQPPSDNMRRTSPIYNGQHNYSVPLTYGQHQPQNARGYGYQSPQGVPPQPYYPQTQQQYQYQPRPMAPIPMNRPQSFDIRRTNDGTHPRMSGPMRATAPPIYHGVPVHTPPHQTRYSNHPRQPEPHYGSIAMRRDQIQRQSPPTNRAYHTMNAAGRPRISSDSSNTAVMEQEIRGASSESNVHHHANNGAPVTMRGARPVQQSQSAQHMPRPESVPSGKYMASSSMSSLRQYAQLVTNTGAPPPRADSTGNLPLYHAADNGNRRAMETDLDTRHSYNAGNYNEMQSQNTRKSLALPLKQGQPPVSDEDVFDVESSPRRRGPQSPTSPVNRQPSYLNAMNTPVRQRYTGRGADHTDSKQNDSAPTMMRSVSHDESQNKIIRRTSYLMATSKPDYSMNTNSSSGVPDDGSSTPVQKSNNMRKLKNFFGERTPSIREAQEKAAQNSSATVPPTPETYSLPENLEVNKAGILGIKVVAFEGKRSNDRSWKAMGAALCGHMLYLLRDKKENATLLTTSSGSLSVDDKPISIKSCLVNIAHGYTKKKHVFQLITKAGSEYMLQAEDHKDMVKWIQAIDNHRNPDKERAANSKSEQISSAALVKRIYDQQQKMNQKKRLALSFRSKQPYSPSKSNGDSSSKKDDKKKRPGYGTAKQLEFGAPAEPFGDFGIPLNECTVSHENEHVPLVVELCTKAIEEHGLEFVGVYRVPGNKAGIQMLKTELKQGVINAENEKWRDVNVLSSLLKDFLRKLPDSLITLSKYKRFIEVNRIADPKVRLLEMKALLRQLPDTNFETLKYLCTHLRKVSSYGDINKMDTRNLAIVFGPTIIRSHEDVMSLVTDMSDQCRIIESLIIYHEWMFSPENTDPPEIAEAEANASVAPISETMNNMSAELAAMSTNKKTSKSQLMSAFTNAANKNMSKTSLGAGMKGSPSSTSHVNPNQNPARLTSSSDDHGFKDRDINQVAAARNQRLIQQKERESRENISWVKPMPHGISDTRLSAYHSDRHYQQHHSDFTHSQHPYAAAQLQRWHSEESVLDQSRMAHSAHNHYTHHLDRSDVTPPPLPARGLAEKPPLPPRRMELYHAKPAQAFSTQTSVDSQYHQTLDRDIYENCETLEMKNRRMPNQHGGHVIQNPLAKANSLARRGSLDSMMDSFEPYQRQYSSSLSTESQDGSDLVTASDEKLQSSMNSSRQRPDAKSDRKPHSDNGSLASTLSRKGTPDSPMNSRIQHRSSSDRSRESLQSTHSNVVDYNVPVDRDSSDRGFAGSSSSLGSGHHRDPKIGIASRIERTDMKPIGPRSDQLVNSNLHTHIEHSDISSDDDDDDEKEDYGNNNNLPRRYARNPLVQRRMSDEKKKIRRRHTVGGARDFELFKDILANHKLNEDSLHTEPEKQTLTAWQRLQPRDSKEPLSIRDWIERERFRASSPELERNIMHFQQVGPRMAHSVLQSNT